MYGEDERSRFQDYDEKELSHVPTYATFYLPGKTVNAQ